jgi:hypothetical protein
MAATLGRDYKLQMTNDKFAAAERRIGAGETERARPTQFVICHLSFVIEPRDVPRLSPVGQRQRTVGRLGPAQPPRGGLDRVVGQFSGNLRRWRSADC